ncbi:MAG: hypothetical protein ACI8PT_003318 [Gammaproteobacteria bacterium]|jgi:hypothetical protein
MRLCASAEVNRRADLVFDSAKLVVVLTVYGGGSSVLRKRITTDFTYNIPLNIKLLFLFRKENSTHLWINNTTAVPVYRDARPLNRRLGLVRNASMPSSSAQHPPVLRAQYQAAQVPRLAQGHHCARAQILALRVVTLYWGTPNIRLQDQHQTMGGERSPLGRYAASACERRDWTLMSSVLRLPRRA